MRAILAYDDSPGAKTARDLIASVGLPDGSVVTLATVLQGGSDGFGAPGFWDTRTGEAEGLLYTVFIDDAPSGMAAIEVRYRFDCVRQRGHMLHARTFDAEQRVRSGGPVNEAWVYFKDSRPANGTYRAPSSYQIQFLNGSTWTTVSSQVKTPASPVGNFNKVTFTPVTAQRVRVLMTNASETMSANKSSDGVSVSVCTISGGIRPTFFS